MRHVANAARFLAGLATLAAAGDLAVGAHWPYPVGAVAVALGFYGLSTWIDRTTARGPSDCGETTGAPDA